MINEMRRSAIQPVQRACLTPVLSRSLTRQHGSVMCTSQQLQRSDGVVLSVTQLDVFSAQQLLPQCTRPLVQQLTQTSPLMLLPTPLHLHLLL
mmetsp:Transcript_6676/g.14750  ORF Transcript_6676/g.14750 Transcript_6676/m.14750 type:complete len:93 (-) Transcript_6676:553-831(-)